MNPGRNKATPELYTPFMSWLRLHLRLHLPADPRRAHKANYLLQFSLFSSSTWSRTRGRSDPIPLSKLWCSDVIFSLPRKDLHRKARRSIERLLPSYRHASTRKTDQVTCRKRTEVRLTTHPTPLTNFQLYSIESSPKKYRELMRTCEHKSEMNSGNNSSSTDELNWFFLYKNSDASTSCILFPETKGQCRTTVGLSQCLQSITATTLASSDSAGRRILVMRRPREVLVVWTW